MNNSLAPEDLGWRNSPILYNWALTMLPFDFSPTQTNPTMSNPPIDPHLSQRASDPMFAKYLYPNGDMLSTPVGFVFHPGYRFSSSASDWINTSKEWEAWKRFDTKLAPAGESQMSLLGWYQTPSYFFPTDAHASSYSMAPPIQEHDNNQPYVFIDSTSVSLASLIERIQRIESRLGL